MDKLYGAVSMCRKAGKLMGGFDAVKDAAQNQNAFLVLLAQDASERTKEQMRFACKGLCPVVQTPLTQQDIAFITQKEYAVLAVTDANLAALCRKTLLTEEETD